jgi:hypothetical protein
MMGDFKRERGHTMRADSDVIAVIDSILAEAGDERAPLSIRSNISYPDIPSHIVQGWVDRLRGIRAALEAKE